MTGRLVVVTDRHVAAAAGHELGTVVAGAVEAGADAVLVRDRDLSRDERADLAARLAVPIHAAGAELWLAGPDAELADAVGAAALHLAVRDATPTTIGPLRLGRSCHDEAQVTRARDEAVAHVTVSPVAVTVTKPGYGPPLGPEGLHRLVDVAGTVEVLALGGVLPAEVARWCEAGATGVAVLGGVVGAADPTAATRAYRRALDAAPAAPPLTTDLRGAPR